MIKLFQRQSVCYGKRTLLITNRSIPALLQTASCSSSAAEETEAPWEEPFKHALPKQETTYTDFKEANVNWDYVKRLLPLKVIPEMPKNCGILPSGWRPPKDPPPDLPYYIRRGTNHLPILFLERRRDELNPKTMDFEYVELVSLRGIDGDVFACEKDLRSFLERELGQPVATNVDELKNRIKVKGADRSLLEKFVFESGF
ncbi:mitochondrial large subunit ribosomal protein (Img2) domain-containing protein [Ditylenchus destructor]|uniref:Large ribosomal subunit protein mL49 n=1 Tax=Ditylenchus destructor TaxID=166010 RepID=A0AAD4ND82_9BILA|nr:mitochondrial large subunit ribosomal protein (Img2) domain-containing protein [Ditylenchus destructor]